MNTSRASQNCDPWGPGAWRDMTKGNMSGNNRNRIPWMSRVKEAMSFRIRALTGDTDFMGRISTCAGIFWSARDSIRAWWEVRFLIFTNTKRYKRQVKITKRPIPIKVDPSNGREMWSVGNRKNEIK